MRGSPNAMTPTTSPRPNTDRDLARARLDERLRPLHQNADRWTAPRGGWLRAVRRALGMGMDEFARRLGITRSSATRLERSEQRGAIQLETLRRAADALGCDLAYVLIPREPLQHTVDAERLRVARAHLSQVRTHMLLEDQYVDDERLKKWREEHALHHVRDSELWKQP